MFFAFLVGPSVWPSLVAGTSAAAISVARIGTVASVTVGHHTVFLAVDMDRVVASAAAIPIASTSTMCIAEW